jgi:hypothetical protein
VIAVRHVLARKLASACAAALAVLAVSTSAASADPLSITSSTPPDSAIITPQGSFSAPD